MDAGATARGGEVSVEGVGARPTFRHQAMTAVLALPVPIKELIAGGATGTIAKTCIAPLERCKILFQTGRLEPGNLPSALKLLWRLEGLPGMFRGNGAMVARIVPYSAVHFGMYEQYRRVYGVAWYGAPGAPPHAHPALDFAAGASAGASAVLLTYPLDLARTRLAFQLEDPGTPGKARAGAPALPAGSPLASARLHRPGIVSVLRQAYHQGGSLRSLYVGMGASFWGILPYAGLKFYVYQSLKQAWLRLDEKSASVAHPLERVRFLSHHPRTGEARPASPAGGPPGGPVAEAVEAPLGAVPVPPSPAPPTRLPIPLMLANGAVSGLVAQTATYPFDVVRRRMQVEGIRHIHPPVAPGSALPGAAGPSGLSTPSIAPGQEISLGSLRSTPRALMHIWRTAGFRALFAGLSINYLKVVPSTAIGFATYDYLKAALGLPTHL